MVTLLNFSKQTLLATLTGVTDEQYRLTGSIKNTKVRNMSHRGNPEEEYRIENIRLRQQINELNKALSESKGNYDKLRRKNDRLSNAARKEINAELLKTKNLESIGTLAGGIAHDFNNLLMAITGYIALAKTYLQPDDKIHELLSEAERISFTGKDLTQHLITFSRGGEPAKNVLDINALVRETVETALLGSGITARFLIPYGMNNIEADGTQLRQVINNIIINAREAMPLGGMVSVYIDRFTIGKDNKIPLEQGDYTRIFITDEGRGIPGEVLQRIFDPYFTTKTMGARKGTGLGLAVAYSIVKKHNGCITVESTPGKGTTFHIYLPLPRLAKAVEAQKLPLQKGKKKKILFMDDEKTIRDIAGQIIDRLGYEAVLAENGLEAIELYSKEMSSGDRFEVVILDLTVKAGLGGRETMDELLRIDPGVKAIISTGYTNNPIITQHSDFGFAGAITKPYKAKDLKELLERVTAPQR